MKLWHWLLAGSAFLTVMFFVEFNSEWVFAYLLGALSLFIASAIAKGFHDDRVTENTYTRDSLLLWLGYKILTGGIIPFIIFILAVLLTIFNVK